MATIRWPPCFALFMLASWCQRSRTRCQVGFAAQNHNPEFSHSRMMNCAPAMPASPKTKKDRPAPCPSQSHLACVMQRNLLARVERIRIARSNIELGPAVRSRVDPNICHDEVRQAIASGGSVCGRSRRRCLGERAIEISLGSTSTSIQNQHDYQCCRNYTRSACRECKRDEMC